MKRPIPLPMTDECEDSDPGEFVSEEGLTDLPDLLDFLPAVVTALATAWGIAFALKKERLEMERQRQDEETQGGSMRKHR